MRAHSLGLVVLMAAACTSVHADGIYRWTDRDGHVHYGDRAPDGAGAVVVRPHGLAASRAPTTGDASPHREKQRRLLEAFEKERAERQAQRAKARAQEQARAARCDALRTELKRTREAQYLYREGDGGRRAVLSDHGRAEYMAKLEDAIARQCG